MKFAENTPIYVQIANDIKDEIVSGKLAEGDKLRSIREYSVQYEVTALTMQRAMGLLELEEVVHTKKGVGSFVNVGVKETLKGRMVEGLVREFIARMANMGLSADEVLDWITHSLAQEDIALNLREADND